MKQIKPEVSAAIVLCQVEKAKEDMLNRLYISIRIASLPSSKLCTEPSRVLLTFQVQRRF